MEETTPAGTPEPDGTAAPAAAEAADGNASPARDEEWERLRAVLPECREPEDVPEPARRLAEEEGLPWPTLICGFCIGSGSGPTRSGNGSGRRRRAPPARWPASGPNRSRNRRPSAGRLKRRCGRKGGGGARDEMALSEDGVPASPYATGGTRASTARPHKEAADFCAFPLTAGAYTYLPANRRRSAAWQ